MSDKRTVAELRSEGCVVIVWKPQDIQDIRESWSLTRCREELAKLRSDLEERSVERGWNVLEILLPQEEP